MGQSTMRTWMQAVNRNEMLKAERTLAQIRLRLRFADDAEIAAHSQVDVPLLVGAVDGVLALHRPAGRGGCRGCSRRRRSRDWHRARYRGWPCATVRAVNRALNAEPAQSRSTSEAGQAVAGAAEGSSR